MNKKTNKLNIAKSPFPGLFLAIVTVAGATASTAATNDKNSVVVDSVHQWGPWELDIAPAAGGIEVQTTRPLTTLNSKVTLRTNSISALAPTPPAVTATSPVPTPPVIPVTPPVTPPIAGPADGLF